MATAPQAATTDSETTRTATPLIGPVEQCSGHGRPDFKVIEDYPGAAQDYHDEKLDD